MQYVGSRSNGTPFTCVTGLRGVDERGAAVRVHGVALDPHLEQHVHTLRMSHGRGPVQGCSEEDKET